MTTDYRAHFDLSGKTAVVTGACGMLGPGMCEGLAQHGARLVVSDIKPGAAAAMAARLAADHGVECLGLECDVSDEASVVALGETVAERFGAPDILLNNAANAMADPAAYFAPFDRYALEEWRRNLAVDLDGVFLVAKHIGGAIAESGRGGSMRSRRPMRPARGRSRCRRRGGRSRRRS